MTETTIETQPDDRCHTCGSPHGDFCPECWGDMD